MVPFYLDGMAATLHQATGARGVVIVSSWGFEDLCAHRALVALADDLADAGCPALRIDLSGTGDSLETLDDIAAPQQWVDDILHASAWLRTNLGCTEVALVGIRLGALLVAQAARRASFESVTLLAPPRSGRTYLRELRVLSRVIDRTESASREDVFELAGFTLPQTTIIGISELRVPTDLRADRLLLASPTPDLAIAAEDRVVTHMPFEGYDALMCDPTAGSVPRAFLTRVANFISIDAPRLDNMAEAKVRQTIDLPRCTERLVRIDANRWGVYCAGADQHEAIILVNAGGVRRTGWARIWVDAARELATEGVSTLRLDLSHLDPPAKGGADDFTACYREEIRFEIAASVDWLARHGYTNIGIAGLCSGAYQALQAALIDQRVTRLVLINQLCYEWTSRDSLPMLAWVRQKSMDVRTRRQAEDDDQNAARRLSARAVFFLSKRIKSVLRLAYGIWRRGVSSASSRPVEWLRHLSKRGVAVDIVMAEGDGSVTLFEQVFGPLGERLADSEGIRVTVIADADHLLTPRPARNDLIAVMKIRSRAVLQAAA